MVSFALFYILLNIKDFYSLLNASVGSIVYHLKSNGKLGYDLFLAIERYF